MNMNRLICHDPRKLYSGRDEETDKDPTYEGLDFVNGVLLDTEKNINHLGKVGQGSVYITIDKES
jgi:hypothetical protein